MSKCFCHFNGYEVKDGKARDDIENLKDINTNFYPEIYYYQERRNDTNYYVLTIPKLDSEGNLIKLYVSPSNSLSPNEYAIKNNTNVTINGSLAYTEDKLSYVDASVISEGKIIRDYNIPELPNGYTYLGIKEDGTLVSYQANSTTAQQMIDDGVKNAVMCWYQIVKDSVRQTPDESLTFNNIYDKDQYIGQKENGDVIIFTVDGRNSNNRGLSQEEVSNILIEKGVINAWMLDGGGSASTSYRGIKINENSDEEGTKDRKIAYLLNVKKEIINKPLADVYGEIGKTKQLLNKQLRPIINDKEFQLGIGRYRLNDYSNFISGTNVTLPIAESGVGRNIHLNTDNSSDHYLYVDKPGLLIFMSSIRITTSSDNNTYLVFTEDDSTILSLCQTIKANEINTITGIQTANVLESGHKYRIKLDASDNSIIKNSMFTVLFIPYE